MNNEQTRTLIEKLTELLDLPGSAYESAKKRYDDLGQWFGREDSSCRENDPHIFPQGSFRLGTAIRPLDGNESYDLDLACSLRAQVTSDSHTQRDLKLIVGDELELYRLARGIKADKEEKHRCWRLEYADGLNFHMDIVPCIPAKETNRQTLFKAMESYGLRRELAADVSALAVSITDDRHPNYSRISEDWQISNPEGYAQWFESRMEGSGLTLLEKAQVDEIPIYKRKTPLQRVVQLLKRHRDTMFADDPDVKPISVIITTIAANSYSGSSSLEVAMEEALTALRVFAESEDSYLPNPVNPAENFADRWVMPQYKHLNLRENFRKWVWQVNRDFQTLSGTEDVQVLVETAKNRFSLHPTAESISRALGLALASAIHVGAAEDIGEVQTQPWNKGFNE
jgi:hypothetical protein